MPRQVILLRGINLGAANRVSMPELREVLTAEGFTDVATYMQSGNIAVSYAIGREAHGQLAAEIKRLLAERFELSVPVLVRTHEQLTTAVRNNPFADLAERDPKHFLVTFLSQQPDASAVKDLEAFSAQVDDEFAASGHAIYSWHPGGIHLSKLATTLTEKRLGVDVATARNWTTVMALLEMCGDG
jgi:uncharacterized protein (DUF1697 family)